MGISQTKKEGEGGQEEKPAIQEFRKGRSQAGCGEAWGWRGWPGSWTWP